MQYLHDCSPEDNVIFAHRMVYVLLSLVKDLMRLILLIHTIYVRCVALRNLDLLIKTDWRVICPLSC